MYYSYEDTSMIEPRQNIKNLNRMRDFGSNREQIGTTGQK